MFKNMTIKTKLVILTAISLAGLALSISFISINKSTQVMIKYELEKLSTVEVTKHSEIEKYFSTLKGFLTSMALNQETKEAFEAFEDGFYTLKEQSLLDMQNIKEELKADFSSNYISRVNYNVPHSAKKRFISSYIPQNENAIIAQYMFITDNINPTGHKNALNFNPKYKNSYMQAHKKYHSSFNTYLESFHLYDIFLVDLKGDVIYTDFKEKDFATNLKHGAYSKTGLASVYKKALGLSEGELAFEDFTPYEPSYNKPASFISTPIFIDGKKRGVLVFQMPVDQINKIMQLDGMYKKAGLGETGECYLVGQDYMMRSNSRFQKDIENKTVQNLKTTIGVWEVKTKSTKAALEGDTKIGGSVGKWIIKDYRGVNVLSVYHAIDIFSQAKWAIIAEIDEDEVLKPILELKKALFSISIILLILFALITLYFINILLGKPLEEFQVGVLHFFEFLKGNENNAKELDVKSNDEIGKMAASINQGILITKENFQYKEDELWVRDGMGKLNSHLTELTLLSDVSLKAINFISKYLNAGVGVLYIFDDKKEELQEYASYAHIKRDSLSNNYALGDGIVGQVALQRSPIELTSVDNSATLLIETGTISKLATHTYTYPLVYQDNLFGVIELGSLKQFNKKELDFLNASNKIIAIALSTSLQNTKVKELLEKTEIANSELKTNQDKLQEANVRMEEQQQRLEINNAELEEQQQQLEAANLNMEEQQQQLEEANANMEEQQQQLQISEQNLKLQNKSLESAKDELEESSKYKSEFLANMSHELRTPLNAIILLSQLLEKNSKKTLSVDDVKKAKTIFSSGNELLRLINDILDLSKVESGKMEVIVDQFDSTDFLETIENLFEHSAKEKGLELIIIDEYKDIILSDRDRISQIVRNLISNALKFTSTGSITVKISHSNNSKKPIKISVSDTGIGIPHDKQEQIFKAFTQADGSTSRKYGGTGLGLSISKELTHLLGGDIYLQSKDGEGSTFSVEIPNLDGTPAEIKEPIINISKPEVKTKDIEINDDRKILNDNYAMLVIDDDVAFADVVYENIKNHGHFALIAHNAIDGLALVKKYNISGIMLDLTLPDMDGIEVLKELKNDSKLKDIPVHIISSKDKDDISLKMGAIGYGQKPLLNNDIDGVISKLEEFIKSETTSSEIEKEDTTFEDIDLSDLNILVVDDDIKNIFVLDTALSEYDANVQIAYNGKEAIEKLRKDDTINIVLMDIMMPVMDGYEAIETIRADKELSNIPIIAVTAKAMKEDKDKCISMGADDFISKPIDANTLIKLVKVWSEKKHR